MKKIITGVILVILSLIIINTTLPKFENLSLEEIKGRIKETKKIYICKYRDALTIACPRNERIRTIDDEETIKEFVSITNSLGLLNSPTTMDKDGMTIYLVDEDDKVLMTADFFSHYTIKTKGKNYEMEESKQFVLRELLGFPPYKED